MNFPVHCSACRHVNHFEWKHVGQRAACDGCGTLLTVPAPMETIDEPAAAPPPRALKFRCPSCRRKFATKPDMAGQKIRCSGCGAGVRVPWAVETEATPSSQMSVATFAGTDDVKTMPAPAPASAPAQRAQRVDPVRADIPRLDITRPAPINGSDEIPNIAPPELDVIARIEGKGARRRPESLLTSRSSMIELALKRSAEEEAALEEEEAAARAASNRSGKGKGKGKKRKKHSSYFDPKETLKLIAGVGALVAVLAFLAWGYPDFRFPLGGFMCVVGFIVYAMGAYSLRQVVAEEGMIKLIAFRLCPPYQWWFVATRWQETRDFFAFFLAGAITMSLGGAIIKVSPVGKEAEANERAYQKIANPKPAETPRAATNRVASDPGH